MRSLVVFIFLVIVCASWSFAEDQPVGLQPVEKKAPVDELDEVLNVEEMPDADISVKTDEVRAEMNNPPAFVLALQAKSEELRRVKAEVAKLKAYIVKIREASRREKAVMYYNMGCVYKSNKLYVKAKDAFLKALENNPMDSAIHYNLAIIYDDDLKDNVNAKKHYERFLELAPDDADAPLVVEWLASLRPISSGL